MMHPTIERTMMTGYPFPEPTYYDRCTNCHEENHVGEEVVEHADNYYCSKECLVELMIAEGSANLVVIEQ